MTLFTALLGVGLWLGLGVPANAAPPQQKEHITTRAEIAHLLRFVRQSDCDFKRNGTWHTSPEAADHIERKLDHVRGLGGIDTAEDFIERAASESSWTGIDYSVKCPGQLEQTSRDWLVQALRRYRVAH